MKKLIITFFLTCLFVSSFATTYYIANNGNDTNNGTSISTPWQTLDKVNTTTLQPNDQVLFRRGDTFYGKIILSGTSNNVNITFGAYGTGNDPIITGFTSVTSWTNKGGNIWESTNAVSSLSTMTDVVMNGQNIPMGRYPNGDLSYPYLPNYFNFQSHTGTGSGASSITSSSLIDGNNWTGADLVIRMNQWTFHKDPITSQSGTTLSFNGVAGTLEDNWGFWIQNDIRTLDQQNEWYYNPSTKKISIYSTIQPINVQVSTVDTLFYFYSNIPTVTSVTLDHLQLTGANGNAVWISGNLTFSVTNCNISNNGLEGIFLYGGGIQSGLVDHNTFYSNGASGLYTLGTVSNLTITNNNLRMHGIISPIEENMYSSGSIEFSADNSLVQYNTIDSSTYCGINFNGANTKILNNFINHSAVVKGDDAGIYTGYTGNTGKVIDGNIILNSLGNPRGARSNDYFTMGIYSDDFGNNLSITNNFIMNARTAGIYIHNSNNEVIRNNTIYNCGSLFGETMWANGGISIDGNANQFADSIYNNRVTNNYIFARTPYQYTLSYYSANGSNDYPSRFGILDSNYYTKVNGLSTLITAQINDVQSGAMTLAGWQSLSALDANSIATNITDTNNLRPEYNETNIAKTVSLGANYKDILGNSYVGTITLQPYSGIVLIYDSPLATGPITVTGWNQDVLVDPTLNSLPGSSITHDFDGAGYSFYMDGYSSTSTKLSNGIPISGTITSPSGTTYQLQPYNQNNALRLGVEEIGTLTLTTPDKYSTIKVASTSESSTVNYTITYTDGTSDNGYYITPNWGSQSSPYAINNLGRVDNTGTQDGTIWSIYENTINPDPTKDIKSISFNSAGAWLVIFAVSNSNGGTFTPTPTSTDTYLEQGNSATITSSISGSTYLWKEISTDFNSGATIVSPTSKTTSIIGLPQGVFYFEATVNGSSKDTVVVKVNKNLPPKYSVLWHDFHISDQDIVNGINYRGDTTNYFPQSSPYMNFGDSTYSYTSANWWLMYRDRMNGMSIDSSRGKLYTTIEDGYGHGSISNGDTLKYARTEIQFNSLQDTNRINMYEWKGYFPKPPDSNYLAANKGLILAVFQIHGSEYDYAVANFELRADGLYFRNEITGTQAQTGSDTYQKESAFICSWQELYNKSHTLRVYVREGQEYVGQKAFLKVELDGVTKYYRNVGGVGSAFFDDYVKIGSLYDWSKAIVNPDSLSRGRKFSIANESLKQYILLETAPFIKTKAKQFFDITSTNTLTGTVENGTSPVSSYQWSKISGGNATITNPTSTSTTVTGLTKGVYTFNLSANDNNNLSSSSNVDVVVDSNRAIAATGYNYDVIVDGVLNGTVSSLRNHDMDGSGYSFYGDGFSPNSTALLHGLTSDGVIVSPTNTVYHLQPYNQNNALYINTGGTGTLSLTSPASFDKIKIALTSGGTPVTYTINYSDGTNDVVIHTIQNWGCLSCTGFAINDLGRVDDTGTEESSYWAIYEDSILPNPNKTVNSITFTSTGSWVSIFGLTDVPAPIMAPTIAISGDQSITVDNTNINAVATWAAGHTGTYSWSQISGPNSSTITTPNNFSTSVTGLTTGIYKYQCIITQDDGQTAAAVVTVTATIPVVINAGTDVIIYLTPIQPYNAN